MCGIAGVLGLPPERARPAAARMLAAMRHRGPDDAGSESLPAPPGHNPAQVVHARLSIIDLSPLGHQPMRDGGEGESGANWVVFNGEVFNFGELRDELSALGHAFRSRSDTEVILRAYRQWGEAAAERFRGMFAFALFDRARGTVWFCRDRLGIKPLYLHRPAAGGLLFGSEVRALLAAGDEFLPRRVDARAVESFLAQGMVCGQGALVRGVELLAPGTSRVTDWSGATVRERAYWRIPFAPAEGLLDRWRGGDAERPRTVRALGDALREAVRLRLVSDVPLGLFLSGGVDSAALATVATEVGGADLQTVSIGFDQREFDESAEAAAVARALGTRHRTVRLSGAEMLEDLPQVFAAVDQPTVDGFNTFFVSRAARRAGLTVALSGLGGDELFGGYASFGDVPRAVRAVGALRRAPAAARALAKVAAWRGGRAGVKYSEALAREGSAVQMYLLRRELFLPAERRSLQARPEGSDAKSGLPAGELSDLSAQAAGLDLLNQVSSFELRSYMRHMLLRDGDVFSMAVGLEARVPLLDHKVVELAAAMPGRWKRPDPRPKPLLLDAVGPRLPREVYTRPKRGFTFPWDAWLRGPMRERAGAALCAAEKWEALGFVPRAPAALWARFLERDPRVAASQMVALWVLGEYVSRHGLSAAP